MPGISSECGISQTHGNCKEVGCRCRCHYTAAELVQRVPSAHLPNPPTDALPATPPMAGLGCPKCHAAGRAGDKFCRFDGTALKPPTQHCPQCGAECPTDDFYCYSCGSPLTEELSIK